MFSKPFASSNRNISEIGMGTYYDPLWIASAFFGWRRGAKSKIEAMRKGLASGITLIDTAEIYRSEPLVAIAIRGLPRKSLFLASKVWSNHLRRDALIRSFEKTLRNIGTEYLDLYQVHFPNPGVPIKETMLAMQELVEQGKLLHIGVSNFNLQQLIQANEALSGSQISAVQLDYSLLNRRVEHDILPYCIDHGIALLAYYPLGHGKLASDARLDKFAQKYQKTRSQIALRWLAQKEGVFPIPRASRLDHVHENLGASGWSLSDSDVGDLEVSFSQSV